MQVRYVDMRKSPRIEVNAPARIVLITGKLTIRDTIDCKVVNISDSGALLAPTRFVEPSEFYLETLGLSGRLYSCCVVRREGTERLAVRFV